MPDDKTTQQGITDRTIAVPPMKLSGSGFEGLASLIVLAGWEIGREISLTADETVFGRSLEADVTINVQSMSRQHAKIVRRSEGETDYYEVIDLNSMNGTRVNNEPVTTQRLEDGDKILMGDTLLKFVRRDPLEGNFYREVHRRIHYDQLTGLLELESFLHHLDGAIEMKNPDNVFTLAMTDLDGLKRVNDTYGHLSGRAVVKEMGAQILRVVRPQDHAGLYGGDECILLFPGTKIDEAQAIAEKLRLSIESHDFENDGQKFRVSISQGLAEFPTHARSAKALIAAADRALYNAKAAGRNCIRVAEL